MIGFNFYFWDYKDNILSDFPFLLFSYACLYLAEKTFGAKDNLKLSVVLAFVTGLFLYLSYGTRSVGIVLLPSILFADVINCKKLSFKSLIILSVFLLLASLQNLYIHSDGSYFDQLYINHSVFIGNIKGYICCMIDFWNNGFSTTINKIVFTVFSLFALLGFLFRIKKMGSYEIYLLLYSAIILVYPVYQGTRYLIPIIPLYLFYLFYFFTKLTYFSRIKLFANTSSLLVYIVIGLVGITYGLYYYKNGLPVFKQGIYKNESQELFKFIKSNTNDSDVIVFSRPRVMALMTSRSATAYHQPEQDEDLWRFFREINASYAVEPRGDVVEEIDGNKNKYLSSFISRNSSEFITLFHNSDFNIYKINKLPNLE